jgi:hypothetical protein
VISVALPRRDASRAHSRKLRKMGLERGAFMAFFLQMVVASM